MRTSPEVEAYRQGGRDMLASIRDAVVLVGRTTATNGPTWPELLDLLDRAQPIADFLLAADQLAAETIDQLPRPAAVRVDVDLVDDVELGSQLADVNHKLQRRLADMRRPR